jgi:hypothetical protein
MIHPQESESAWEKLQGCLGSLTDLKVHKEGLLQEISKAGDAEREEVEKICKAGQLKLELLNEQEERKGNVSYSKKASGENVLFAVLASPWACNSWTLLFVGWVPSSI